MIFSSGNSNDFNGKILAKFWKKYTGKELYSPYSAVGIHSSVSRVLLGVIIFTEYTGSNVEVHMVTVNKRALDRATIRYIADYVFNYLNCNVLRVKLHSKTQKYIEKYLIRLGFKYEFTLEKYFGVDSDAIMYKFIRDNATKWIKLIDAKSEASETSTCSASSQSAATG